MTRRNWVVGVCMMVVTCAALRAQDEPPATQPAAIIKASDKAAIDAALGSDVVIEGTVAEAAWSRTGKVMNIEFLNAEESRLLAVVFDRKRQQMDEAFGGDLARALTGAKVRLKGTLQPYGGRVPAMQGRPQIILEFPSQITILEQATGATTQAGAAR